MCGIVAHLELPGPSPVVLPPPDLDAALGLLHHRGPDGRGTWTDANTVGLGHTRLSIMDVAHGAQPLHAPDDVHAVVNGEFYEFEAIRAALICDGHAFATQSDSEILVHLYREHGVDALEHLVGEFAFVLWDGARQQLFCGRDRYGIKPLFYTQVGNRFLVASEAKAFLALGWSPQWDVHAIASSGYFSDQRTLFLGVNKLPPAHSLVVSASGSKRLECYFRPTFPHKRQVDPRSLDEMVAGVRDRLYDAVRTRLRSDVPVAVYLSGGIDSSSVLGIALDILRQTDPDAQLDAFTISFTDREYDGVGYDEGDVAARTASHARTRHHVLKITQADLTAAFADAVWHWEAPLNDFNGAAKFLLSRYVRDAGFKVVLTGEGADEHFAGYSMFYPDFFRHETTPPALPTADRVARLAAIEATDMKMWSAIGCVPMSFDDEVKSRTRLANVSIHRLLSTICGLPKPLFLPPIVPSTMDAYVHALSPDERRLARDEWHPLHTALCLEPRVHLPNYLCNHLGDRSEMAHSIEEQRI
ncbi:asparagine synthase (glutamine-hydrolyzing) [Saprolegnia diclina VS20]|uniref:Asparagine synthase (Glutamine-hydrolyzing) n=1 Tax=Saprolegnia diclina (strain VS20) TaxID=1156394 RepID=T0R1H9_SAPDV|nr:asparagine synthase (glutamine-hydrolyzing) [Saprolegnia diclina VS20]EQC25853.1 asparagine synthase (glutamine-hydrolyzing) [Saprolegnia diclina VS20]|eukprot:XP_008620728.1 asparagine synthase (glutamine-hydrolyzing) [Saprolegnia diclina VS20]